MGTRIPKPHIKPPTTTFKMPVAPSTSSLSAPLRPITVNKDTVASRPPPTRKFLSRRSKSAVDLRPVGAKPILKSATKDLPSQITARKRPAPAAEDTKPKQLKVMKPAPYDYKARYNLLNEKHTKVVDSLKEAKQKLVEREDYDELKENFNRLCAENNELLKTTEELNSRYSKRTQELETRIADLKQEVDALTRKCATLTVCLYFFKSFVRKKIQNSINYIRNKIDSQENGWNGIPVKL